MICLALVAMIKLRKMPKITYLIRPMKDEDIPQVAEIDREAFSSDWLFPSYRSYIRDLHSSSTRYIVASLEQEIEPTVSGQDRQRLTWLERLFSFKRPSNGGKYTSSKEYIVGFASFWLILKEAHLTAIAVRSNYRRSGIGERLLISVIELAIKLNAEMVTLEVRASNEIAQALYKKHGFQVMGRRPRYYSQDGEDAIVMSTDTITSAPFQAHLEQLKRAHSERWGIFLVTPMT